MTITGRAQAPVFGKQYNDYLKLDWNLQPYKKYVPQVGSATVQQVVRKNNEAWRAFLGLKRMEKNGRLSTIKRVQPPGSSTIVSAY